MLDFVAHRVGLELVVRVHGILLVSEGRVFLGILRKELLIVPSECQLLLDALVIQRNELESRFIKCLHQVEIGPHLHLLELLPRLSIQPNIVVICGNLQLLLLLFLRQLPRPPLH